MSGDAILSDIIAEDFRTRQKASSIVAWMGQRRNLKGTMHSLGWVMVHGCKMMGFIALVRGQRRPGWSKGKSGATHPGELELWKSLDGLDGYQ